jgi:hypothetical protein
MVRSGLSTFWSQFSLLEKLLRWANAGVRKHTLIAATKTTGGTTLLVLTSENGAFRKFFGRSANDSLVHGAC